MTNRRDLLKLFGAGASIVPIIGGAPVVAAQARLIEPPKIEPMNGKLLHDVPNYHAVMDNVALLMLHHQPLKNTAVGLKNVVCDEDDNYSFIWGERYDHFIIGVQNPTLNPSAQAHLVSLPVAPLYVWTVGMYQPDIHP